MGRLNQNRESSTKEHLEPPHLAHNSPDLALKTIPERLTRAAIELLPVVRGSEIFPATNLASKYLIIIYNSRSI